MRHKYIAALILLCGCGQNTDPGFPHDASISTSLDGGPIIQLVCAADFCGNIVDKNTGITANCGACPSYSVCGDNNIPNVCGTACIPLRNNDTAACDFHFGSGWGEQYGTEEQFSGACNYINTNACEPQINVPYPNIGPCAANVCGTWWCCVSNPDAGVNPLLPGSIANNDGGLP